MGSLPPLALSDRVRYHDHGDTIAIQYGGSHLVNTMETYRKINQWTSHSRDMVESFKRYYNNSFLDSQRQEAYNLFLGNYIFTQGQPMLWDLATDYYLHHSDPRAWSRKRRRSYITWFTPEALRTRELARVPCNVQAPAEEPLSFFDDYWLEYYRPLALSSFVKLFSYKMNSTLRYIPFKSTQEGKYDLSPFCVRTSGETEQAEKKQARAKKGVNFSEVNDESSDDTSSQISHATTRSKRVSIHRWLQPDVGEKTRFGHHAGGILKEHLDDGPVSRFDSFTAADRSLAAQWTLDEFVDNSLNPSVTAAEAQEYERYVSHPLNLPLVVSTETPANPALDLVDYVNKAKTADILLTNPNEHDLADYAEFLTVSDNPLTVGEADAPKKRYKAYRQWLKGKSLFKQLRVDA